MAQYCYEYPRPAVAVDIAVLQWRQQILRVLLIQRAREPFAEQWALPGGFVDMEETCAHAASRELEEETGLADLALREAGVFDAPGRDPRGRTISVAYLALIPARQVLQARGGDDASRAEWFEVRALPALAFDHVEVIAKMIARLRQMAMYRMEGLRLLPESFTLADLQAVHEAVLGRRVNPARLQARLQDWGVLEPAGARSGAEGAEPVYRVNGKRLEQLQQGDALAALAEVMEGT